VRIKVAYETGRTVRDVAMEVTGFDKARLDQLLDSRNQTGSQAGQEFRADD
jgi:hypothetical protein